MELTLIIVWFYKNDYVDFFWHRKSSFVTAHMIARNWLNSFDFFIQSKTPGKNDCCLVAYCVLCQLNIF